MARRLALRLLWTLGTAGRAIVFVGLVAAALAWAAWDATRPESTSTDAIFIAMVLIPVQCVLAGLWSIADGLWDFALGTVLARWIIVVVATGLVAPIYNQTGDDAPPDYALLLSDAVGGILLFGSTMLCAAISGWLLGRSLRPPDRREPARAAA